MTRSVYSAELWSDELTTPGSEESPSPDAGTLWVVRDISVYLVSALDIGQTAGFAFWRDSLVNAFWVVDPIYGQTQRTYHWEGRKVIEPGHFLTYATSAGESQFCVCGYILTLP